MRTDEDSFDALSDPDTAGLLRLFGVALGAAGALTLAVNAVNQGGFRPASVLAAAAGTVIYTLVRLGRLRVAAAALCWTLVIMGPFSGFNAGGLTNPVWAVTAIGLVLSGWLLSLRSAVAMGLAAIAGAMAVHLAFPQGKDFPPDISQTYILTVLILALVLAVLIGGATRRDFLARQLRLVTTSRDQLAAANTALKASDERLRSLLNLITVGVCVVDRQQGSVVFINEHLCRMLALPHERLMAALPEGILADDLGSDPSMPTGGALQDQARVRSGVPLQCGDGRLILAEISTTGIDLEGRRCLLSLVTDVTARLQAETLQHERRRELETLVRQRTEDLQRATSAAQAANEAKSAFLANMSHEIRTPMNAVIGLAHLIRKEGLSAEQIERMGKLEGAAGHLLDIINAILDLSKIDAGKFVLEERPVRVDVLVANALSMLGPRAEERGLLLSSEVDPLPANLVGDAIRLEQALLNYANNAIKFTDAGSVTIRVRLVQDAADRALIRFEVEDTGMGIDPAVVPRLFSAFEQADSSSTRRAGGTGLGLAITRKLAELMGGEAGVRSSPGAGSLFWFTAWLHKQAHPEDTPEAAASHDAEARLKRDYAGTRVLLAEDNDINAEVAKAILEDVDFIVDLAVDGVEAVALADRTRYRLVLMDMQMPRMDGLEATREIRRRQPASQLPIIAMTANAFAEDKERCRAAGMDDFLSKPAEPEALYSLLLKWLQRTDGAAGAA